MKRKFSDKTMNSLRLKVFGKKAVKWISSTDPLSILLRTHLLSENILEELIKLIFDNNANAILSLNLTYRQKLELVGKIDISEGVPVLPDYIVGSLRKLNSLRNKLSHNFDYEITCQQIEELYTLPNGSFEKINNGDVVETLKSYVVIIFPEILSSYKSRVSKV